jgi:hypothetical protein
MLHGPDRDARRGRGATPGIGGIERCWRSRANGGHLGGRPFKWCANADEDLDGLTVEMLFEVDPDDVVAQSPA